MSGRKVFAKYRAAIYDAVASDQRIWANWSLLVNIIVIIIKIIDRFADRTIVTNDGVITDRDIIIDYGVITDFDILADFNIFTQPNVMIIEHDLPPFDTLLNHRNEMKYDESWFYLF